MFLEKDHFQDKDLCVSVSPFTTVCELMHISRGAERVGYSQGEL